MKTEKKKIKSRKHYDMRSIETLRKDAIIHLMNGEADIAIELHNKIHNRLLYKDPINLIELAKVAKDIAICYESKDDFSMSLDYYLNALMFLSEKKSDKEIQKEMMLTYHNIAIVNSKMENFEKAIINANKSLKISKQIEDVNYEEEILETLNELQKEVNNLMYEI